MAALLPPPPLPPKPALLLNQQGQRIMMAAVEGSRREATPMIHASAMPPFGVGKHFHYADDDQLSTIRRRSKRDRNRTLGAPGKIIWEKLVFFNMIIFLKINLFWE